MLNSTLDIKLSNDELAISQIMNRMIYLIVPCILASLCYTIYTGQNRLQIFALIFSSSSIFILTFLVNKNKIQLAKEIADVVERNCKRAAELVTSFKQVAIDQTSMRHRKFYLEELLKELILTLKPQFKRSQIELKLEAEADILMESYPGALEQVLTNFITNALLHAFQSDQSGVITIHAFKSEDNKVTIIHQDNGLGISPEIQRKVFDPFFTTKLGQGGSGLGLYLVFNFVTRVLQGNVRLESQPGCTLFILTLPLVVREGIEL